MTPSPNCIALIQRFEGCKLACYDDLAGVPTIGWGHTGPEAEPGTTTTQEYADWLLQHDVDRIAQAVNAAIRRPVTQNQFDAIVSFSYNVGAHAFANSTLCRMLNAGDTEGAAAQFVRWDMAGGEHVPGLLARREAEAALFSAVA
jgi:lysozyme